MKNVSLKLDDPVYFETEEVLEALGKSRNRYINEAVAHYNVIQKRELIKAQLERESKLVSAESMKMNRILEELGDGDEQI
jgi:predicted transcriptional regulator